MQLAREWLAWEEAEIRFSDKHRSCSLENYSLPHIWCLFRGYRALRCPQRADSTISPEGKPMCARTTFFHNTRTTTKSSWRTFVANWKIRSACWIQKESAPFQPKPVKAVFQTQAQPWSTLPGCRGRRWSWCPSGDSAVRSSGSVQRAWAPKVRMNVRLPGHAPRHGPGWQRSHGPRWQLCHPYRQLMTARGPRPGSAWAEDCTLLAQCFAHVIRRVQVTGEKQCRHRWPPGLPGCPALLEEPTPGRLHTAGDTLWSRPPLLPTQLAPCGCRKPPRIPLFADWVFHQLETCSNHKHSLPQEPTAKAKRLQVTLPHWPRILSSTRNLYSISGLPLECFSLAIWHPEIIMLFFWIIIFSELYWIMLFSEFFSEL